jgi:uncharacterized protein YqgC (DUF456 family)
MQSPYGKAAAYAGLALVTPVSGYVCYLAGGWLNGKLGASYLDMAGMLVGCALGMYESFRQAMRIEGLDRKKPD